jgi:hypothetical protein
MHDLMRAGFALAAIALVVGAAACNKDSTPAATTTPTTPTVARTTDTFSGTVPVGGSAFHTFAVTVTGTIDVTLTVAGPPSTVVMGLSIGTPAEDKCTALAGGSVNTAAGSSAQLSGLASPGPLCVGVRDVGNQTAPVTYTVTVVHP